MTQRLLTLTGIIIFIFLIFGCSGKSGSPVTPSETGDPPSITGAAEQVASPAESHELWGLWMGMFIPQTGTIELVGLREAEFHLNITKVLQAPMPTGISIVINDFDPVAGTIDVDLGITHPFPNTDYRIFDTRLIIMGAGDTIASGWDSSLIYPAPSGFRVQNADGYTRWWNAPEFKTPGIFGFLPSDIGFKFYVPEATLNGYKYYADPLTATAPVVPDVNTSNRGTFSTDMTPPKLDRNFQLQFPVDPDNGNVNWLFQLAVDTNWDIPTGSSPPPKPIDDFPLQANCPEAFHIEVNTEGSTAWFTEDNNGGDISLQIEVFDWGAPSNFNGINGEIGSILVESETLFDMPLYIDLTPSTGSQNTSGIYEITIPGVHPTGIENQEILVIVTSSNPNSYAPPGAGFDYPLQADLAAFALVEIPISNIGPTLDYITVDVPNGGEIWEAGSSEDILWTSVGIVGTELRIAYSLGDGPEVEITPSTENDGTFTWDPIPMVEHTEAQIYINSVQFPAIADTSDNFFTITIVPPPEITVTVPNGGEIWNGGDAEEITWTSSGAVGPNVQIAYTTSDGLPISIIGSTENDGTYIWDPIPEIINNEVRIRITDLDNPVVFDESDAYFEIFTMPDPEITVLVPNGFEVYQSGTLEDIIWSLVGDVSPNVSIGYTIDDGPVNEIIAMTDNIGFFTWDPIPDVESDQVKVIVADYDDPLIFDWSDDYFTIQATPPDPEIIVTVPNGGEFWATGGAEEITWVSIGDVSDNVTIGYSIADGIPVVIFDLIENDGSYIWDPIPDLDSSEVRIIISDYDNPSITDESDEYFSIHTEVPPEIVVIIPNGGEVWYAGDSEIIEWDSLENVGPNVVIEYTISDSLVFPIAPMTENDGSFTWDPIFDIDSDEVRIKVSDYDSLATNDVSDAYFSILPMRSITVTVPNGGEDWKIGSSQSVEWTSESLTGQVKIEYTLDDGTLPVTIAAAVDDIGSFTWDPVIGPATTTARVIITSIDFPSVADQSDEQFTITEDVVPPSLTLTSPNGGEELAGGGIWDITWDYAGGVDFVRLLLSTDSGATYPDTIVESTGCDGSFTWDPVPAIDTIQARVKIEWVSNTDVNDESDADFTITTEPVTGWNPIVGLTQVALDPVPDQGTEPVDIMLFSEGDNESRGEITNEPSDNTFSRFDDTYTGTTGPTWDYATFASPLHKFDVSMDGAWVFITNSNSETFPSAEVNDLMYCAYTACDNSNGDFSDTFWHLYGDGGDPDPDELPWRRAVDFSCGVPGGIDDITAYHLVTIANHPDNPQPHDGNILLGAWTTPYDADSNQAWLLDLSTQGGGQGLIDDTDPGLMALAVDDNTDIEIDDEPAVALWVLGSDGVSQCNILVFSTGDVSFVDNQLDSEEFGTAIPVDLEFANAKDFGYSVSINGDFNWLCALLDNGDGTWSVGVWECDYLAGPPAEFALIDITDPIAGTPMGLDVDGTDFEIHVLADNGGTIELTVFDYTP